MKRKTIIPQKSTSSLKEAFNIDLDIINSQIKQVRDKFSEASEDGKISQIELDRIVLELRILEKLLICFLDKEFNDSMQKSRREFTERYEEICKLPPRVQTQKMQELYKEHILFYFGELIRVSTRAMFLTLSQDG